MMSSEANNIKNYSADDIRRYWNNEMSAQEMRALEIAAMDDPFLADALEGYSKLEKDPSNDLALLKQRIAERAVATPVVSIKTRNQWMRIAAILILLAGFGVVTFKMMQNDKTEIAKNQSKSEAAPVAKENATATQPSDQYRASDSSKLFYDTAGRTAPSLDVASAPPKKSLKNLRPSAEEGSNSSAFSRVKEQSINDSAIVANEVVRNKDAAYKTAAAPSAVMRKESTDDNARREKADSFRVNANAGAAQARSQDAEQVFLYNTFSGKVVDMQNRSLAYATVRMNNANQIASTDQYGMFQFKSRDSVADITILYPGYQDKNLTLNGNQSGIITMDPKPSKSKLSEVVVTAEGRKKAEKQSDLHVYVMDAEPVIGWDKYNRYLDSNKIIPANEPRLEGEVVLSFKVNTKGELSSFDIEHSLSKSYDKEAIRLIKEGPGWRVTNGKKTRVKVIVRF